MTGLSGGYVQAIHHRHNMGKTSVQQNQIGHSAPITKITTEISFLSGYKTYLVAFIMAVYALSGWYLKDLNQAQAMTIILNAAGLVGLRSGIESVKNLI